MSSIGVGLSILSLGRRFRAQRATGTPTQQSFAPACRDNAAGLAWSDWLFGRNAKTYQGGQTVAGTGTVSGVAGTATTGQGSQSAIGAGTVAEHLNPLGGFGQGVKPVFVSQGRKFRALRATGTPTLQVAGPALHINGPVWQAWFFGNNGDTGQGGQSAVATGTVSGIAGSGGTGQGSQTAAGTGTITLEGGISGVGATGQGGQTAVGAGSGGSAFYLYVGSDRATGNGNCSLHKLDARTGEIIWSRDTGATVYSVAINVGNSAVYCGGGRASNLTTHRYTAAGDSSWSADHGTTVNSVSLDASENLFTGGLKDATSGYNVRKYAGDGTEDTGWRKLALATTVYGIHAAPDGNIYLCGDPTTTGRNARMYNAAGTMQWEILFGTTSTLLHGIRGLSDSSFVVVGDRSSSVTTKKYNADRTAAWTADHVGTVNAVDVDADGGVYTAGARSSSLTTRTYDSSGTLQWSADHGGAVQAIAVDAYGQVYTAGNTSGGYNVRKYDRWGNLIWSQSLSATCYGIAVEQSVGITIPAPSLPVPLGLGLPDATNFVVSPALALAIALGVPAIAGAPLPPDPLLFVLPPQAIYRCLIVDATGGLAIPLESFQCRRRAGESTWLSVICPYYSDSLRAAIAARAGAALVIRSGVRSSAGVETLGDFLQSVLTAYEYERTPAGASITLTGRVVPSAHTAQTRALTGIQTRSVDEQGRKQVRCAVDPLLRPGDTSTALDWSFEVGAVLYFIGARDAYMTVTEAA